MIDVNEREISKLTQIIDRERGDKKRQFEKIRDWVDRLAYDNMPKEVLEMLEKAYFSLGEDNYAPAYEQWQKVSARIGQINVQKHRIRP